MSINNLYYLWQKLAYALVHGTTIWLLFVFFSTAGCLLYLSTIFSKQNARAREAILSKRAAAGYAILGGMLWLFSMFFS